MIYKLNLSNKETIHITEEELAKFKQNIGANFIEFSNGIVNPSFVISITIDHQASGEAARIKNNELLLKGISAPNPKTPDELKNMRSRFKPSFLRDEER